VYNRITTFIIETIFENFISQIPCIPLHILYTFRNHTLDSSSDTVTIIMLQCNFLTHTSLLRTVSVALSQGIARTPAY